MLGEVRELPIDRRVVLRAAELFGAASPQELHLCDWGFFPCHNICGDLRDTVVHMESTVPQVPLRQAFRKHQDVRTPARGLVLYQSRAFPSIHYVIYTPDFGTQQSYYFVRKGELFRLIRGSRRMVRRFIEREAKPPILDPSLLNSLQDDTVTFLRRARVLCNHGLRTTRGILLAGSPGNGKTMACRWIQALASARGWDVNIVTNSELQNAFFENTMSSVVSDSPITFFDDIDIAYLNREAGDGRMACSLLAAMDGIEMHGPRIWVFATNEDPRDLDPAFLRPGRIDKQYLFGNPNEFERRRLVTERWPNEVCSRINVDELIESTEGFSFAEMEFVRAQLVTRMIIDASPNRRIDPLTSVVDEVRHRNPRLARRRHAASLGFA